MDEDTEYVGYDRRDRPTLGSEQGSEDSASSPLGAAYSRYDSVYKSAAAGQATAAGLRAALAEAADPSDALRAAGQEQAAPHSSVPTSAAPGSPAAPLAAHDDADDSDDSSDMSRAAHYVRSASQSVRTATVAAAAVAARTQAMSERLTSTLTSQSVEAAMRVLQLDELERRQGAEPRAGARQGQQEAAPAAYDPAAGWAVAAGGPAGGSEPPASAHAPPPGVGLEPEFPEWTDAREVAAAAEPGDVATAAWTAAGGGAEGHGDSEERYGRAADPQGASGWGAAGDAADDEQPQWSASGSPAHTPLSPVAAAIEAAAGHDLSLSPAAAAAAASPAAPSGSGGPASARSGGLASGGSAQALLEEYGVAAAAGLISPELASLLGLGPEQQAGAAGAGGDSYEEAREDEEEAVEGEAAPLQRWASANEAEAEAEAGEGVAAMEQGAGARFQYQDSGEVLVDLISGAAPFPPAAAASAAAAHQPAAAAAAAAAAPGVRTGAAGVTKGRSGERDPFDAGDTDDEEGVEEVPLGEVLPYQAVQAARQQLLVHQQQLQQQHQQVQVQLQQERERAVAASKDGLNAFAMAAAAAGAGLAAVAAGAAAAAGSAARGVGAGMFSGGGGQAAAAAAGASPLQGPQQPGWPGPQPGFTPDAAAGSPGGPPLPTSVRPSVSPLVPFMPGQQQHHLQPPHHPQHPQHPQQLAHPQQFPHGPAGTPRGPGGVPPPGPGGFPLGPVPGPGRSPGGPGPQQLAPPGHPQYGNGQPSQLHGGQPQWANGQLPPGAQYLGPPGGPGSSSPPRPLMQPQPGMALQQGGMRPGMAPPGMQQPPGGMQLGMMQGHGAVQRPPMPGPGAGPMQGTGGPGPGPQPQGGAPGPMGPMGRPQGPPGPYPGSLPGMPPPAGSPRPPRPMMMPPGPAGPPHVRPPPPHQPPPPPSPFPGLLYTEGRDTLGRPVVVLNTAMLPPGKAARKEEVLAHLLQQLQPVVQREYVLVVLSLALGVKAGSVSSVWALGAYRALAKPYRKNVKHIVLVQPSAWARALLALSQPFVSKKAAHKVKKVDSLAQVSEATGGEVKLESLGARFIREIQYGVGASPLAGLVMPGPGPGQAGQGYAAGRGMPPPQGGPGGPRPPMPGGPGGPPGQPRPPAQQGQMFAAGPPGGPGGVRPPPGVAPWPPSASAASTPVYGPGGPGPATAPGRGYGQQPARAPFPGGAGMGPAGGPPPGLQGQHPPGPPFAQAGFFTPPPPAPGRQGGPLQRPGQ